MKTLFRVVFVLLVVSSSATAKIQSVGEFRINTDLISGKPVIKDSMLYITAKEAVKEKEEAKDLVFVDIRNKDAYVKANIPGSLNMPVYFIKSQPFLADKTIVLVDTGHSTRQLEKDCKQLLEAGRNVFILDGGLFGLNNKNTPIRLRSLGTPDFSLVPPDSFHTEKNYDHYIIADVSKTRSNESKTLVKQAIHLPVEISPKTSAKVLKKARSDNKSEHKAALIVFNENGQYTYKIKNFFKTSGISTVFYLKNGLNGYGSFCQNLTLLSRPVNERKAYGGKACGTCPK